MAVPARGRRAATASRGGRAASIAGTAITGARATTGARASTGATTTGGATGPATGRGGATIRRVLRLGLALAALTGVASETAPADKPTEVVASRSGFSPRVLSLRKGETVRLLLRTADDEHCFAVDAFRVEKRIVPGKPTTLDLTPDRTGSFPFYCCLEPDRESMRGRLVVAE